jgi:hypothetical protein
MGCSAQEMVDAIITAGELRGADGRGEDGLDGYMSMLASTSLRQFGILLGGALRLKMQARRDNDDEKPEFLTLKEARAEFRKIGIPERVVDYLPHLDRRDLPAMQRKSAQPNGTRAIGEAVINAAIRHGSDGRGRSGLTGFMLMVERTDPQLFAMFLGMAQRWQAKHPSKSPEPDKHEMDPEWEEYLHAVLDECWGTGPERERRDNPYPDPEADDMPPERRFIQGEAGADFRHPCRRGRAPQ